MNWLKIVDENGKNHFFNLDRISEVSQETDNSWTVFCDSGFRSVPDYVAAKLAKLIENKIEGSKY